MSRHPKLTPEQIREIMNIELPPVKERGQLYRDLAKKYEVSISMIKNIKTKTTNPTTEAYMRISLKKEVTLDHAKHIIADIYNDYYKEKPTEIRIVDRYGVCQIYILPAKIIIQLNEIYLTNLQKFVQAVDRHIRNWYNRNEQKIKDE